MTRNLRDSAKGATWLLSVSLLLVSQGPAWAEYKPLNKEEQQKVDQAIDRGVKFLESQQYRKGPHAGTWNTYPNHSKYNKMGYTLLPVLTLLECGVPADDPGVRQAVELLRKAGPTIYETYDLALALLVLDRLKEARDKPLIESLALRLIAGQCRSGGWCYVCPKLSEENEGTLLRLLQQLDKQEGGHRLDKQALPKDLPRALRVLTLFQDPALLPQADPDDVTTRGSCRMLYVGTTDNSSTQFALLGLWTAQRHGIPIRPTLRLVLQRFLTSQSRIGTWGYRYHMVGGRVEPSSRAMTTVGLLALACAEVAGARDKDQPIYPRLVYGLAALAREIDFPTNQMRRRIPCPDLYFMWSVERVGVLCNLQQIGGRDWYRWGAEILVTSQGQRGQWPPATVDVLRPGTRELRDYHNTYGTTIDTCFALLFLKRSNLTADLTAKLPFKPDDLSKGIVQALENPQAIPQTDKTSRQRSQKPDRR